MENPTAEVAAILIQKSLSNIYDSVSGFLEIKRIEFIEDFSDYCNYMLAKNSCIRTLYSKNKPVILSDIYITTKFNDQHRVYIDSEIIRKFSKGKRIVIKGNGGSGKTIFLKHLWVSRFEKPSGKIPIFIELRRLNNIQSLDIVTFCRSEMQADASFGPGVFEKLCAAGKFEFIFDGFDEVNKSRRKSVERQILDLAEKYEKCCILVSGREDDRFSSWGPFEIYTVEPLSLEDTTKLISKIKFDNNVKRKFLKSLTVEFYNTHRSFLSSPLLSTMMLLIFYETAIIPEKITAFYDSAFQTLLTWHDATKDSFERDRSLSVDDFRVVFSTFCLITYYEYALDFDEIQLRRYAKKAIDYHNVAVDIDDAITDMCESANLIQKDGLKFVFVHRSFQEYFAAECAMRVISGKAGDLLSAFAKRPRDNVFSMCYEIHPELAYDEFLSQKISDALNAPAIIKVCDGVKPNFGDVLEKTTVTTMSSRLFKEKFAFKAEFKEKVDGLFNLIDLCSKICHKRGAERTEREILNTVFNIIIRAVEKVNHIHTRDVEIKIEVLFEDPTISIKVRNSGAEKIAISEINRIKSSIHTALTSDIDHTIIFSYFESARDCFGSLRREREFKEKSIDKILGL